MMSTDVEVIKTDIGDDVQIEFTKSYTIKVWATMLLNLAEDDGPWTPPELARKVINHLHSDALITFGCVAGNSSLEFTALPVPKLRIASGRHSNHKYPAHSMEDMLVKLTAMADQIAIIPSVTVVNGVITIQLGKIQSVTQETKEVICRKLQRLRAAEIRGWQFGPEGCTLEELVSIDNCYYKDANIHFICVKHKRLHYYYLVTLLDALIKAFDELV